MTLSRPLPMRFTVIHPAKVEDGYGDERLDYGDAATRVDDVPGYAWLSLVNSSENTNGRDAQIGEWTLITTYEALTGRDRIERDGETFEVDGPPAKLVAWPAGRWNSRSYRSGVIARHSRSPARKSPSTNPAKRSSHLRGSPLPGQPPRSR